jgi:DNA-binding NarL/FixJ family response regulator
LAFYQQGELHRLRGEFAEAEEAYRLASQSGQDPYPGLALLRLAQGQVEAADASIRRAMQEARGRVARAKLLSPCVEIMLAGGDAKSARAAADELSAIADDFDASMLRAMAAGARGAVLLEQGDPAAALPQLRAACAGWQQLQAPYEHACARILLARACRELGDRETADLEIRAARQVFQELGAGPDQDRVAQLLPTATHSAPGGLTAREIEVLARVARGRINREIAAELVISEHTVRRHLQNIYIKLGVSSRAAATAYALEHQLI